MHVVSNAVFLAFFTYLIFGYFGFWVFPVLGLAMAALTNYFSLLTYPPDVSVVGASGLVSIRVLPQVGASESVLLILRIGGEPVYTLVV
jgi:hypothetical protein